MLESRPLDCRAASAGWPICLGYLPIGMAFGVLAQKAGLTPLQIGLMSILVFAGSSQFIAVSMLTGGASAPAIIATTFVVNLRHVLMSSALAVYLRAAHRGCSPCMPMASRTKASPSTCRVSRRHLEPVPGPGGQPRRQPDLVCQHRGRRHRRPLHPEGALGIDYALIAMFICLLIYQIKSGSTC
jgi:predicted branched-subunit amino acid permease